MKLQWGERALAIVALCCASGGCVASAGPASNERASPDVIVGDSLGGRHADVDLTGAWATGGAGEPATERVVLHPPCNYSPAFWAIEQEGDTIRLWKMREAQAQGIARSHTGSTVPAVGRIHGSEVRIDTADERYELHLDSVSRHLRGTLNGAPFWAVRLEIVRPDVCLPVP